MRTVSVRALQRGLTILEYFNQHDGTTVTEIMGVLGAPHATTYRLLKTLCDEGLLTKGNERGEYWLAAGVKALSEGYQSEPWLLQDAMPIIEALSNRLQWPVFLMLPRGTQMVVRAKNFAPSPLIKGEIPTGTASEMTATAGGLAYLAFASPAPAMPDTAAVRKKIAQAQKRGHAQLDEARDDVRQIAVPVLSDAVACGALMIRTNMRAAPERGDPETIHDALVAAAAKIAVCMPAAARNASPLHATA